MEKLIKILAVVVALNSYIPAYGQIDWNYFENVKKAVSANSEMEYQASLEFCGRVLAEMPYQPRMNYITARLYEQMGNRGMAVRYLKIAAKLGYTSKVRWFKNNPLNDPVFTELRGTKEFLEINEIMENSDKSIQKSRIEFILKDESFSTEGVSYNPAEKMFYLGGNSRIIKVDHMGNNVDFTTDDQKSELGWINGIHIDSSRNYIWACSNDEKRKSPSVTKFDLSTGKLLKKYTLIPDGKEHMFNDLVIHLNGDVYITDSNSRAIYLIQKDRAVLELFYENESLIGPNGITFSGDQQSLLIGGDLGIYKIDFETRKITRLDHADNFNTYGIDGLYFADNYLYGIQNMLIPQVSRFTINKNADYILDCEYLERNSPYLRSPTTGVIAGDIFYFIANARAKGKNETGIVVMKTSIRK